MKKTKNKRVSVLVFMAVLFLWEGFALASPATQALFPPFSAVIKALITDRAVLWPHLLYSLTEAGIGIIFSLLLAGITAILMDESDLFKKIVHPFLIISQTIPIIVLAPLLSMYLGFGFLPKIIVVILMCYFPITISLYMGLSETPENYIFMMKTMGATKPQIYTNVKIPHALPHLFSGLEVAVTYAMTGAVVGEWIGGSRGLGVYLLRVKNASLINKVFAAVLLIIIVSILLSMLVKFLARIFMPYKKERGVNI